MNIIVPSSLSEPYTKLNYNDGLLYCSLLSIDGVNDWRMIEDIVEWNTIDDRKGIVDRVNGHIWFKVDVHTKYFTLDENYTVVPVRDL